MNTKFLEKYTIKPKKKKKLLFQDLAKKHMVRVGKKTVNFSKQIDQIVYGVD